MTAIQEQLMGALVGLARATNGGCDMSDSACRAMICGLTHPNPDEGVVKLVRNAKRDLVPACSVCANPCGRTEDFDPSHLKRENSMIRERKLALYELLRCIARQTEGQEPDRETARFLFEGLFRIGYEETADSLNAAINAAKRLLKD